MAITKIQTVTVGAGGAASIDFTSIPGTYTDLMVVLSLRVNNASNGTDALVQFNSDSTGANYSWRRFTGNGATASDSGSGYRLLGLTNGGAETSNTFGSMSAYIPNYTGSTQKTYSVDTITENNSAIGNTYFQQLVAGKWTGTAAITSLTINLNGSQAFVQYSSATLYGITKGSSGGVTVS